MSMPIDLVLVRHGESEGNSAKRHAKHGDVSDYTPEFLSRHSSKFRLTDRGRDQAISAGEWLRKEFPRGFDRHYVSEYVRAVETAGLLDLPSANWYKEFYLREQDYGQLDVLTKEEQEKRFTLEMKHRDRDGFFWTPPGGESMATLCLRFDRLLGTLHRECSDKQVLVVCHGKVMLAARVRLERLDQRRYAALDGSKDPRDRVQNCQVFHYTRRDPKTGRLTAHLNWMRSVCPWDTTRSSNEWTQIERPRYSNKDLLNEAAGHKRLVNNRPKK